ncbi:LapA family protein [Acidithiobacillus sp. AMEEHan]|uniref:LapA family protein n=1 Tax=Acidithiobacillus sp. AMEEHan TaxID=2994951 RepID=UPI0027E4C07B|nr:LapA family protein [Acidithiobacillus sp. AMEEHan]
MWILFSLLLAGLAVLFAVQNNALSGVRFFTWEFQQSIGVIVLIAFFAGALASAIFYLPTHLRNRWRIRRHARQINELEKRLLGEQNHRLTLEQELHKASASDQREPEDYPPQSL